MLLTQTSQQFRTLFIVEFTKELIKNSKTAETQALEKILREKIKENIEKKQQQKELYNSIKKRTLFKKPSSQIHLTKPIRSQNMMHHQRRNPIMQRPIIPQQRLPSTVQNISPQPAPINIDLGKLNALLRDSTITAIECSGTEKNIIVRRGNQIRTTAITLNREEIDDIIEKFSREAKIPIEEGIMKIATGNLIMTAIISEVTEPKFIIEKMGLNSRRF